ESAGSDPPSHRHDGHSAQRGLPAGHGASMNATTQALRRLATPLRLTAGAGWLSLGLGLTGLPLGLAAWSVRLGLGGAPGWVLAAWVAAAVSIAVTSLLAWKNREKLSSGGIAGALERDGSWRRGALTSLLDQAAEGTSDELFALADREQAADLARRGPA